MLKKLGSEFLYYLFKSINSYSDINISNYVIHPDYLSIITEEIDGMPDEKLREEKLGSNLLYLVLKSIDRLSDTNIRGYVFHPDYLPVIAGIIEEFSKEELQEIKHETRRELSEGAYFDNKDFLKDTDNYFADADGISDYKSLRLYDIIVNTFNELKAEV